MITPTPFLSLLVANRGEIALRIMRTARAEGLRCIAIYTDADAEAPHVMFADAAVCIGAGPVTDSYMSTDRILQAAQQSSAQAVHPGYGFLSENPTFAQAVLDAGLVFVGPSPQAIAAMGNKAQAKRIMISAGVPCIRGYEGDDQSTAVLSAQADRIGYPLMIKAAAGGGGRGMRLVEHSDGFSTALDAARAESLAAFGSDEMILEQAVARPRHVEVQVFADQYGSTIHLGERDCSIQRRHQKIIEESPCPVVSSELRETMGAAAVAAAKAIGYAGAGTVEFLLDESGAFFFLEMNTRLQVEHPVTECVTGLDIVGLQLAAARGDALQIAQKDVHLSGHAIEARLYAEDPGNGFLPATGDIALWRPPGGPRVRVDDGVRTGLSVSPHYDPMLAKIIAHGDTREEARVTLIEALQATVLFGLPTNRDFLIDALSRPAFASGLATTAFLTEEFDLDADHGFGLDVADIALAGVLLYRALQAKAVGASLSLPAESLGWGSSGQLMSRLRLTHRGAEYPVTVNDAGDGTVTVACEGQNLSVTGDESNLRIDGQRVDLRATLYDGHCIHVATASRSFALEHGKAAEDSTAKPGDGAIVAPMHGNLNAVFVSPGDRVVAGTRVAVLEAMKMQYDLICATAGTVTAVLFAAGTQVQAGKVLVQIEPDPIAD
jgi:geranyl-CoA carboxylase alpha subunit